MINKSEIDLEKEKNRETEFREKIEKNFHLLGDLSPETLARQKKQCEILIQISDKKYLRTNRNMR